MTDVLVIGGQPQPSATIGLFSLPGQRPVGCLRT